MKTFNLYCLILVVSILGGASQVNAATPEEKPALTVHLGDLHDELQALRKELSRTVAALDRMKTASNKKAENLEEAFTQFDRCWTLFDAQAETVRQHGLVTKVRAKEHWAAWHGEIQTMQNPKLREKAEKRYALTTRDFEKIGEEVADAKEEFAPLAADLKDIHTYLQTDLTRDAVSSLSSIIWTMGSRARVVDRKIEAICDEIENTMNKLPRR